MIENNKLINRNQKLYTVFAVFFIFVLSLVVMVQMYSPIQRPNYDMYNFSEKKKVEILLKMKDYVIEKRVKDMFESLPRNIITSGFLKTLLIVVYNSPLYESSPLIRDIYKGIFAKVVTCGNGSNDPFEPDIEEDVDEAGKLGYKCMARAMQLHVNVEGYLVVSDDMVVNWWQFHNLPKDKIWIDNSYFTKKINHFKPDKWWWWHLPSGFAACKSFHQSFLEKSSPDDFAKHLYENYLSSCGGEPCCGVARSDVYYIPATHRRCFIELSNISVSYHLFLEIAVPLILGSCTEHKEHAMLNGFFITENEKRLSQKDLLFWQSYNTSYHYVHSLKYMKDKKFGGNNVKVLKRYYLKYVRVIRGENP